MFVDIATIKVKAGNGGNGHVSFRREKNLAKGGPNGGDGGDGGSVYLVGDPNLSTLMDFRTKPSYKAQKGEEGGKSNMTGANGEDLLIQVPLGTLVYDIEENDLLIGDLIDSDQRVLVATGGRGGRGNHSFKSSTNQAPVQFTPGVSGEEKQLRLEIKVLADVGLVGFPNAGKSTLVNVLTAANAKTGSYPFTTLTPNLGVCKLPSGEEIVVADIPGLIEGASQGKGLGDEFLRHVERTRVLVHMIDPIEFVSEPDLNDFSEDISNAILYANNAWSKYEAIRKELGEYNPNLLNKQEIVVINKLDITEVADCFKETEKLFKEKDIAVLGVSAATGEGSDVLRNELMRVLADVPKVAPFSTAKPVKTFTLDTLPNRRIVFRE
jgi:GTP-binding protein